MSHPSTKSIDISDKIASIVMVAALVSLSILDSLDDRPPLDEILRIEMSRVLTLKNIQREFPEYKDALTPQLAREILAEPWLATNSTRGVIDELAGRIAETNGFRVDPFLQAVFTESVSSDPVMYSIIRRGLSPISDMDKIAEIVTDMCTVLDVQEEDLRDISSNVFSMYRQVFLQIS
jgi:hypothetical protein